MYAVSQSSTLNRIAYNMASLLSKVHLEGLLDDL